MICHSLLQFLKCCINKIDNQNYHYTELSFLLMLANYMYTAFEHFGLDMPDTLGDHVVDLPTVKFEFLTVTINNGLHA